MARLKALGRQGKWDFQEQKEGHCGQGQREKRERELRTLSATLTITHRKYTINISY